MAEPKIGDRQVKVCQATGFSVIMDFTGKNEGKLNGRPGWICLHGDCAEDDAKDVEDFLAGRQPSTLLWTR